MDSNSCEQKMIFNFNQLFIFLFDTLIIFVSGESYTSLQYQYRIEKSTLSKIIPETCEAIYSVLKDDFLTVNVL